MSNTAIIGDVLVPGVPADDGNKAMAPRNEVDLFFAGFNLICKWLQLIGFSVSITNARNLKDIKMKFFSFQTFYRALIVIIIINGWVNLLLAIDKIDPEIVARTRGKCEIGFIISLSLVSIGYVVVITTNGWKLVEFFKLAGKMEEKLLSKCIFNPVKVSAAIVLSFFGILVSYIIYMALENAIVNPETSCDMGSIFTLTNISIKSNWWTFVMTQIGKLFCISTRVIWVYFLYLSWFILKIGQCINNYLEMQSAESLDLEKVVKLYRDYCHLFDEFNNLIGLGLALSLSYNIVAMMCSSYLIIENGLHTCDGYIMFPLLEAAISTIAVSELGSRMSNVVSLPFLLVILSKPIPSSCFWSDII